MSVEERLCESCGLPLDSHQRYCLSCGERSGARGPLLADLLRRLGSRRDAAHDHETSLTSFASPLSPPPLDPTPSGGGLRLPQPRISALLVLVFLGFGALLGSVTDSSTSTLAAAVSPRLKLVLPSARTHAGSEGKSTPAGTGENAAEGTSEPPESEAQPTPSPAAGKRKGEASGGESKGKRKQGKEGEAAGGSSKEASASALPAIKHVFLIVLSDQPYAAVFGPESKAGYLAHTLEGKGELLVRYDAVAHEELANEVALLSGQGPTVQTAANCPVYEDLTASGIGAEDQVLGEGCVYPASTKTLASEMAAKHLSWRAYIQGIDEPGSPVGACAHPVLGAPDPSSEQAQSAGAYATFRNPFLYFGSIVGSPSCAQDDVGLSHLKGDLADGSSTPSLLYIAPDRCHDANPTPCIAGAPAGPAAADSAMQQIVPEIMASNAYKQGGLIAITVDEAPSGGEFGDSSSCCGQPSFPNVPAARGPGGSARGGGAVGALLISPYVKAGTTSQEPYDHFSLLRTIEDLFKVPHLGYAALAAVKPFQSSLFTAKAKG